MSNNISATTTTATKSEPTKESNNAESSSGSRQASPGRVMNAAFLAAASKAPVESSESEHESDEPESEEPESDEPESDEEETPENKAAKRKMFEEKEKEYLEMRRNQAIMSGLGNMVDNLLGKPQANGKSNGKSKGKAKKVLEPAKDLAEARRRNAISHRKLGKAVFEQATTKSKNLRDYLEKHLAAEFQEACNASAVVDEFFVDEKDTVWVVDSAVVSLENGIDERTVKLIISANLKDQSNPERVTALFNKAAKRLAKNKKAQATREKNKANGEKREKPAAQSNPAAKKRAKTSA